MDDEERWAKVAGHALGTCDSPAALSDRFDVSVEDVEDRLLDWNVETCPACGWWVDSAELAEDEERCDGCRE